MLRFIANVRFGEAAPQRRNRLRMSGKGRSCHSTPRAEYGLLLRLRSLSQLKKKRTFNIKSCAAVAEVGPEPKMTDASC
jgi:hypothetical protein